MMASQPTTDTTANEFYHKGRSLWEKRTGDNIPKAIEFYEQAIARDPSYALAYAGLANAYVLLPFYTGGARRNESLARAKEAALKALQLDPKRISSEALRLNQGSARSREGIEYPLPLSGVALHPKLTTSS